MHAVPFQAFGLVDGHNRDGVFLAPRGDEELVHVFAPEAQEGVYRGVEVAAVFVDDVHEGRDIGQLVAPLAGRELEVDDGLHEGAESSRGNAAYLLKVGPEVVARGGVLVVVRRHGRCLGYGVLQGFLHVFAVGHMVVEAVDEHGPTAAAGQALEALLFLILIDGGRARRRDGPHGLVGGVGPREEVLVDDLEHAHYHPHGLAVAELQGLVAHEVYVGIVGQKVFGHLHGRLALAAEDGYVAEAVSAGVLVEDFLGHDAHAHGGRVKLACGGEVVDNFLPQHFHRLVIQRVLCEVDDVDFRREPPGLPARSLGHAAVFGHAEGRGYVAEEGVVEFYDAMGRAVVGVLARGVAFYAVVVREILLGHFMGQQLGVAPAPAVDRLLRVADDEAVVVGGHRVGHQGLQVAPLQPARVLEFVDEEVLELHTHAFVYEGRVGFADYRAQQRVGV